MPFHIAHTHRFSVTHTMLAHTRTPHMKMRKINSKRNIVPRDEVGEMTLKFMLVVKDQTRNLMKMLDARRLDLRVKRVSLVTCHIDGGGGGDGDTL